MNITKRLKYCVEAEVYGFMYQPHFFSSRNAALRFARAQFEWHGGIFFINGRIKHNECD